MNAPENIYIVQWPSHQSPGGKWHAEIPVIPHPEWIYQYIRNDIHAAVVAERDELCKEVERLKSELEIVDRAGHNESESNIYLRTVLIGIKNKVEQALK